MRFSHNNSADPTSRRPPWLLLPPDLSTRLPSLGVVECPALIPRPTVLSCESQMDELERGHATESEHTGRLDLLSMASSGPTYNSLHDSLWDNLLYGRTKL